MKCRSWLWPAKLCMVALVTRQSSDELSFSSHDHTFDSFPTSLGSADDLAPSFSKQLKAAEHGRKLWLSNVWTSPHLFSHMQAPLSGCRWADWTPAPPAPISCVLDPVPHHLRMAVPQEPFSAGASSLPSPLNQKSNVLLLLPFQKVFWLLLIYSCVYNKSLLRSGLC